MTFDSAAAHGVAAAPHPIVACDSCGAIQDVPPAPRRRQVLSCGVCRTELERTHGRDLKAALACASATLLLLVPANLFPFLTTSVLGASRQSRLDSAAVILWKDGFPWLAIAILLFVVIFPLVRFGLLTLVLASLRYRAQVRPAGLARAFRAANALQVWAMPDVFLLGLAVAYSRLAPTLSVTIGIGGYCFILAGVLSLFTRAALDKRAVWREIAPALAPATTDRAELNCQSCDLILAAEHENLPCPRCGAKVHARRPDAIIRAAALTLAGVVLYLPANIYPIATLPLGLTPVAYTIIVGVKDLITAKLFGLALLVFCASFLIPFLKLAGITWCIASVLRRSRRGLVVKTRVYRFIEEIGRWSMVDPFVIACAVPVLQYNELIDGRAEPGATAFAAVVIVTVIAARCFDPRLMWDVAERQA